MKHDKQNVSCGFGFVMTALYCAPALAGSHLWRINEVFSNADGTIQFIEMKECCGSPNEIALVGRWVLSDTTGNQFDFPANLAPGTTANKHLLFATAGFAALPGAPTPDFVIADNFFDLNQDQLTYWMYPAATLTFGIGELPTDGINSLNADATTGTNSPTNFADETGTVNTSGPPVPTTSQWGLILMALVILLVGTIGSRMRRVEKTVA